MNRRTNKTGLTLIEITLVIATIAVLVGLTMPAVRAFVDSFQSRGSATSMISSALASARAMALKHQRYVGVRFQTRCESDNIAEPLYGILDGPQYMIFIMNEEPAKMSNLTVGFCAMQGLKPIKLPHTVTVMDYSKIVSDVDIDEPAEFNDATAFSIIFSPSGKLVLHDVRTRNKDGVKLPDNDDTDNSKHSTDNIFNSIYNIIKYDVGMFMQDDYPEIGLYRESSVRSFIICEKLKLLKTFRASQTWTDCIEKEVLNPYYVSPYSGQVIRSGE